RRRASRSAGTPTAPRRPARRARRSSSTARRSRALPPGTCAPSPPRRPLSLHPALGAEAAEDAAREPLELVAALGLVALLAPLERHAVAAHQRRASSASATALIALMAGRLIQNSPAFIQPG